MIIPELPAYLKSLGGEKYLGLHITIFTITAGLSRPFSGKLADTIGRIPVMIFGTVICFLVGFIYPLANSVLLFLLLRFVHGFSTGFKPTGTSAYVGDLMPINKRGEGMGILGISGSLGMAAGPAIGSFLAALVSIEWMFYASSITAIFSIIILMGMKETIAHPQKFRPALLKINWHDIYEKRVVPPAIVMICTSFSFGIILTIVPDFSEHIGMSNKGLFFASFTLASVVMRFFAGRLSDKRGRVPVIRWSIVVLLLTMFYMGFANNVPQALTGSILFGLASGMITPTLFAWTIDLSDEKHRGRGMATLFIALEIGIGFGSFLSGWIYSNTAQGFMGAFWIGSFMAFCALIYLLFMNQVKYDVIKQNIQQHTS
jgi:MFS family permease